MDAALRDALRTARYMYLTTYSPTGKPGTVPTWLWVHEGAVYFTTQRASLKARRIRQNGRVTVHVGTKDGPSFEGRAAWVDDRPDVEAALLAAYHRKYWLVVPLWMGRHIRRRLAAKTSVLIRITPTTMAGEATGAPARRDGTGPLTGPRSRPSGRRVEDRALRQEHERTKADLARLNRELRELNAIGIKLSAERDTEVLLELILTKAREMTQSDAGSLYLVEEDDTGTRRLRFKLVQNDSLAVPFKEFTLPLSSRSVAGHAALTGEVLNLEDAYAPPPGSPFQIDRAFDQRAGYRTKSMLVVPMKTPKGQVIGVLQLINRKATRDRRFAAPEEVERDALPFRARSQHLVSSLASQAAVALENTRLYAELRAALKTVEESQQRIIQTERLRALGEMAGGVAHDFNNLLAVVMGRAQLLLRRVQDPDLRRQLEVIEQVGKDGAQMVRRIQDFARMRRTRPFQWVDLSQVAREVVEATRSRWSEEAQARGVAYDVRVEAAPVPAVVGDPAELRESLMNVLLNALDAMPQGGRVTFRTGVEGERVYCVVTDTGIGMTEDVRERVFEPFFTTKAEQGTGLGLSIVYGIITRHGGEIDVRSRPGEGSAFTIRLPVGRDIPEAPSTEPLLAVDRRGKILVIEDEQAPRDLLVDLLSRHGHEVVACADGRSGLVRLDAEPFELVIVDLSMPGLSGWEVARLVRARSAAPPVALVTGWGDQIDRDEAREKGVEFVVAKPFNIDEVIAVVARVLSRGDH